LPDGPGSPFGELFARSDLTVFSQSVGVRLASSSKAPRHAGHCFNRSIVDLGSELADPISFSIKNLPRRTSFNTAGIESSFSGVVVKTVDGQ